jgi:hypothetical protein
MRQLPVLLPVSARFKKGHFLFKIAIVQVLIVKLATIVACGVHSAVVSTNNSFIGKIGQFSGKAKKEISVGDTVKQCFKISISFNRIVS